MVTGCKNRWIKKWY